MSITAILQCNQLKLLLEGSISHVLRRLVYTAIIEYAFSLS